MGLIPYVDANFVFHYRDQTVTLDRKDQELQIEHFKLKISHQTQLIQIGTEKNAFYFVSQEDGGFEKVTWWYFLKCKWCYELKELQEIRKKIRDSVMARLVIVFVLALSTFILPFIFAYQIMPLNAYNSFSAISAGSLFVTMLLMSFIFP